MSDPQPIRLKPKPPRAQPLQPDNPGSGGDPIEPDEALTSADTSAAALEKQKEQTATALQNIRDGYG